MKKATIEFATLFTTFLVLLAVRIIGWVLMPWWVVCSPLFVMIATIIANIILIVRVQKERKRELDQVTALLFSAMLMGEDEDE